ncbi:hypothetical protein CGSHiR3021_03768 [Haemophilus influenzae 22.4-21]|uniref:Uncharacterized protein n=1 Tax=Haemophilus influenzae 22.4-21 TaxID=375063 RepID=A4NYY1_HAEIF|nr:hypothetical protein CGSHiR3021_03768 [Haemophilus influenzae 22.4-21]
MLTEVPGFGGSNQEYNSSPQPSPAGTGA